MIVTKNKLERIDDVGGERRYALVVLDGHNCWRRWDQGTAGHIADVLRNQIASATRDANSYAQQVRFRADPFSGSSVMVVPRDCFWDVEQLDLVPCSLVGSEPGDDW